jgi:hypothetical protein
MNVIDIECDIPTKEVFEVILEDLKGGKIDQGMVSYLNVFGPRWAGATGMSPEEFESTKADVGPAEVYRRIVESFVQNASSGEQFIKMLDDAGVSYACIGTGWFASIDHTASLAKKYGGRLIPWLRISPFQGMAGVRKLEGYVKELGFKGFYVSSFRDGI